MIYTILQHAYILVFGAKGGTRTRTSCAHHPLKMACLPIPPLWQNKLYFTKTAFDKSLRAHKHHCFTNQKLYSSYLVDAGTASFSLTVAFFTSTACFDLSSAFSAFDVVAVGVFRRLLTGSVAASLFSFASVALA